MQFNDNIIEIIGHNGAAKFEGKYYLFFGGYEYAEEYNGTIVTEDEVEMAINHEVLHILLDHIGEFEASEALDVLWHVYGNKIEILEGVKETGVGW